MNTERNVWDFVQQYYPKYQSCAEIAENDDLQVLIDGEEEEGSHAWRIKENIKSSVSFGRLYDPQSLKDKLCEKEIENRFNESCKAIYEKAIEGYLESQKEKETVTMTFSIADVDQAMEDNDIKFPLSEFGKIKILKHVKDNFDANASYWDNILDGINHVINESASLNQ